jgi:hypothetical protein
MNEIDNIFTDFIANIEWFNSECCKGNIPNESFQEIINDYNGEFYSYKYNDYLLWFLIRNMCDINTIKSLISIIYKEIINIDISFNVWPNHLYNNNKLYIKDGIKEIIEWNYMLIIENKFNNLSLNENSTKYFLNLLDDYSRLFYISYNKYTIDEYYKQSHAT